MDYKAFIICYLLFINIISFLAFAADKRKAIKHQWRIRESSLFLLAILGGGIGCLAGMLLFHHKTKHPSFSIGIPSILLIEIIGVCCLYTLTGCGTKEIPAPVAVVEDELDQLKNSDVKTVQKSLSNIKLFPDGKSGDETDSEVLEVFTLFFKDFDYKVTDYNIDEDTASVDVELTTIDAQVLAKDFLSQSIVKQIQGSAAPSAVTYEAKDYYLSLHKLLTDNDYDVVTTPYTFHLTCVEDEWQLEADENLDNLLSGNFAAYVADSDLFTPEEMVALYLDTIKGFDKEQMNQFLSLDELFSADAEYKRTISKALAEQILKYLDYNILDSTSDGVSAKVNTEITSCDCLGIIQNYTQQVNEYTDTSQALEDGISGRLTKANQILVKCIENNTDAAATKITMTLVNNGVNWELKFDEALTQAILGNIGEAVQSVSGALAEDSGDALDVVDDAEDSGGY